MIPATHHDLDDPADEADLPAAKGKTTRIGFDDIDTGSSGQALVNSGYHDLHWGNFFAIDPAVALAGEHVGGCGYFTGITSGHQVARGYGGGYPSTIYASSGHFSLESVELTSAWDKSLQVEIVGYDPGKKYDVKVTLTDKHPLLVKLDFENIENVTFYTGKEVADPKWTKLGHGGSQMVFDDLVFSKLSGVSASGPQGHGSGTASLALHDPGTAWHALPAHDPGLHPLA